MVRKLALLTAVVLFASPLLVFAAGLRYAGSTTILESILNIGAQKAFEAKTGAKFASLTGAGTGAGIKDVLDGKADVAGAGRVLKADEKKAGLLGTIIAYDALGVYLHAANPVKNVTKEQLKGLMTGKIKNWKEVGGKDQAVTVVIEPLQSNRASLQFVREAISDNQPYVTGAKELDNPVDMIGYVAKDEGAVSCFSASIMNVVSPEIRKNLGMATLDGVSATDENIKSGAYLLSRPMLLVTKGLPEGDVKKFVDYMLSAEGQAFVEKNFVKVKK